MLSVSVDPREGLRHDAGSEGEQAGRCGDDVVVPEEKLSRKHARFTALEEGVRFFITSLGKPRWVVDAAESAGGVVYHDVTERKWALKGLESGAHGLIAVNRRAGGHAGPKTPEQLMDELGDLGVPLVCAGGVGTADEFVDALRLGNAGVQ